MQHSDLIARLSRIEGQVRALKHTLASEQSGTSNCVETMQQVKAATNALKRFGEAYAHTNAKRCFADGMQPEQFERTLDDIISSAFTLV